jgi:hypothetical protein
LRRNSSFCPKREKNTHLKGISLVKHRRLTSLQQEQGQGIFPHTGQVITHFAFRMRMPSWNGHIAIIPANLTVSKNIYLINSENFCKEH